VALLLCKWQEELTNQDRPAAGNSETGMPEVLWTGIDLPTTGVYYEPVMAHDHRGRGSAIDGTVNDSKDVVGNGMGNCSAPIRNCA
jgi:hypothetical protein